MSLEAQQGARDVVRLTLGRFSAQLILLVSAFIIPRIMGVANYGQYAAWMAVIAIVRSASSLGLPMVEVRFLAPLWRLDRREEATILGSTIWYIKAILAIFGAGAVVLWMMLSPRIVDQTALVFLLGLLALLNYAHEAAISFYLPFSHVGTLSVFLCVRALLTLAVVAVCFPIWGIFGVAYGLAVIYGLLLAVSWIFLNRMAPFPLSAFKWSALAPHISFSLAAWVGTLAWMIQGQFAIFAVANWGLQEEAGILGLTLQVYGFLQLLFLTARRALTPALSQLKTQGYIERLRSWGELMMRYTTTLACITGVGWAMLGGELIHALLTEEFLPVHRSATIILVCVLLYCGAESCNILLYVLGRPRVASANTVVFSAVTILGVLLILEDTTIPGAAIHVSLIYSGAALVYFLISYLSLGLAGRMWLPLKRSIFLALPMTATLLGFVGLSFGPRLGLLIASILGYGMMAVGTGLLPRDELRDILGKVRLAMLKEAT